MPPSDPLHPAQLIYTPEWLVIGLNAAAYARKPEGLKNALLLHVASWVAQFSGHFFAEGRSPALLDNLLGGEWTPAQRDVHV